MKYTLSQFHKLREHDKYPILSLILAVCLLLPILSFFSSFLSVVGNNYAVI